jgi:hypothetical protein
MDCIYALSVGISSFDSVPANRKRNSGYMQTGIILLWLGLNFIVWLFCWLVDLI